MRVKQHRMAKKKPAKQKRSETVVFLATVDEKQRYESAAIEADQSTSDWIRKVLKAELARLNERRNPSSSD